MSDIEKGLATQNNPGSGKQIFRDAYPVGKVTTVAEFKRILKRNGFIDKDSIVIRRRSNADWKDYEFEVITRRCLNVGNLISIEREYNLGLNFIAPHGGQICCIFGKVVPRR